MLLCRTHVYGDITVDLLNYDEELLSRAIVVKSIPGRVAGITSLTTDIRVVAIDVEQPLRFWAGQFVELTIPDRGVMRAYSMANPPSTGGRLEFIIKTYANGAFSALLDGGLSIGDVVLVKGPYGTCFRREGRLGPMLLIGGGSGMSPLWSILHDHIASGERRPVRFFYGARTEADLFYRDELAAASARIPDFRFVPALSHATEGSAWTGETGFIHDVVQRHLDEERLAGDIDAYACGPTPMIDAVIPILQRNGVEPEHIHFDKFTPAVR